MNLPKAGFLTVLLLVSVPLALAQGTYTQIDYPGATITSCWGINAAGDISGNYTDASNTPHGYLLSSGTYTTIDYPGGLSVALYRLNDVGEIVGVADKVGFVYNIQAQTFRAVSYPGAKETIPTAINNAGAIVGFFQPQHGFWQGFELLGSTYKRWELAKGNTYFWGVSATGEVAGYANNPALSDFLFYRGKHRVITIPNTPNAVIWGISNSANALIGITGDTGFLYRNNSVQSLVFPGGGPFTFATGVNDAGVVVGNFVDSSLAGHCFLWTPPADAAKK